jgi:CubicO group peptidase (beta-lactamase class C family)
MRHSTQIFVLLTTLLISAVGFTQVRKDYQQLDSYIDAAVNQFEIPGLAVGIIKNGEIVLANGYGYANTATKTEVDENTVFGIASCSKAFTAACIAILVDEGKLDWNDHVVDILPHFQLHDTYITGELTVEDLLCHRSGYETFDGDLLWYGTDYSREEVVSRFKYRENPYSFREQFGYSNLMFIIAGEVIREVSGMSWEDFIEEKIFIPLGMTSTTTTNTGFNPDMNIAWPHLDGELMDFINYNNSGPAASINSSVIDLLVWVKLMLDKGAIEDTSIFTENQYYKLVSPHTVLRAGRAEKIDGRHFASYGLGWFLYDYQGMKVIHHGGGLPGFHSKVVLVPEDSLGYVILANELGGLVGAIENKILDYHIGDAEKDWASLYLDYVNKGKEREENRIAKLDSSRIEGTKPSLELNDYIGTYEDKMYGPASVDIVDGALYVKLLPAAALLNSPMEHWHYDTFSIDFADPFLPKGLLSFHLNGYGEADYFTIDVYSPDFHFQKLKFERISE